MATVFENLKTEERIQQLLELMTEYDFTAESLLTEIFRFMDPVDIELMLTCIIMKHTEIPLEKIPTK